jgi:transcriptional regulator of acetoin/glycerol metabolism
MSRAARGPAGQAERERIIAALNACAGNQSRAAKLLGIPRRTFLNKLDAYGIPRPKKDADTGEA